MGKPIRDFGFDEMRERDSRPLHNDDSREILGNLEGCLFARYLQIESSPACLNVILPNEEALIV